jgi:phosphoribosylformylglycinamidine cyclo-ligase
MPPVFPWLQRLGQVADDEMFRVFNMGIGLVMIVAEYYAESITRHLNHKAKVPAWIIGEVVSGNREVLWV